MQLRRASRGLALVASGTVESTGRVGVVPAKRSAGAHVDLRLVLAIAAVWILWGSTFAGMRLAVGTIPPFVMAGARFLLAGAI
ncbi:MAG: hypothetical protein JOZ86_14230, partial [Candidatus Eremiobacteraeota bacterium]|nr:hypothetical protein [Candidatus Eremiobacteraeota bacterium]